MSAEENIDISEEIAVMTLTSSNLAEDLGMMTTSPSPSSLFQQSPHSSKHSSITGEMNGKLDDTHSIDDETNNSNVMSSGSYIMNCVICLLILWMSCVEV